MGEARRAFAAMSQPERDLFREGFVQSLTSKIEATGDRRNVPGDQLRHRFDALRQQTEDRLRRSAD